MWLPEARGVAWGAVSQDPGGEKVRTPVLSSYGASCATCKRRCVAYLKVLKQVLLTSSHHKKKNIKRVFSIYTR